MVAVERVGSHRFGRIRLQVATAPGSLQLVDFAASVVAPGSTIRTDGARMLRRLAARGYTHEYVTGYNAEDKTSVLPGVHLVASLLKRWLIGTLHYGQHQGPESRRRRLGRARAPSSCVLNCRAYLLCHATMTAAAVDASAAHPATLAATSCLRVRERERTRTSGFPRVAT
jgi:hypothetical protein